eukprot:TRINITY_DN7386_c0_g1_i1.p1 TRINITY_DN7386_c0_g1~~TRINITY_DN7386_c0_g1_i1.p1  ORF type:complete len:618 (+),score=209.90 TRINITY_DN7386_c0_g1_i1:107-1855(+)
MESNVAAPKDPYDDIKRAIAEQISAFAGISIEQVVDSLEVPRKTNIGDLALALPKLNKFKKIEGKPMDLCKKWADDFKKNDLVLEAVPDGTNLNFKVNKSSAFKQIVDQVFKQKENYGSSNEGAGQTVIVEFSSPNIAKPFHAGHLRSTIIGNFLKNLHKTLGYNTTAINYLGDWGKQYGLLAIGFQKFGNEQQLLQSPIKHLFDVYVAINKEKEENANSTIDDEARAYFKKMEEGDAEALSLWRKFRDLSIVEYKNIYKRLNVEFDEYSGESLFGKEMEKEVAVLEEKKLMVDNQGAKIVDLKDVKLDVALIKKKDGATLYITRDIAAAHYRKEKYNFSKMYYVVAAQQNHHFNQLFAVLTKMGYDWVKDCTHINFGMVKGMSTRRGNVVFLTDILEEAKTTMFEVMKKNEKKFAEIEDPERIADIIGISAVVIQDLSARRIKDYTFDLERMTSFEGDTGPYLQYTHTRLCSMERKALEQGVSVNIEADLNLLVESEAHNILADVAKWPSTITRAHQELEPCVIVTYLMGLSHTVSAALEKVRVVGAEKKLAEARLLCYFTARIVIGNGLKMLGLVPLERM